MAGRESFLFKVATRVRVFKEFACCLQFVCALPACLRPGLAQVTCWRSRTGDRNTQAVTPVNT